MRMVVLGAFVSGSAAQTCTRQARIATCVVAGAR